VDGGAPRQATAATPGCCIPDATTAPDGRLYVTWADASAHRVVVANSSDTGARWTMHTIAIDSPVEPAIAARPDGQVGVLVYDESLDGRFITPKLATSYDVGATWQTTMMAAPFTPEAIVTSACPDCEAACDGTPMGPYQDLVTVPGGYAAVLTLGAATGTGGGYEDVWWYRVRT
jgi:hypothetical protein